MTTEIAKSTDAVAGAAVAPDATAKMQVEGNPPADTNASPSGSNSAGSKPPSSDVASAASPASKVNDTFGKLDITDFGPGGADKPLSPVMAEARRIEDGFRTRYAENDSAMKAVATVMGSGDPDINGHVTKESLHTVLANAQAAPPGNARHSSDFLVAATELHDNWSDMSLSPYKSMDGSITNQSAKDGKERMDVEQFAMAKRILATEMNAMALEKAQAAATLEAAPAEAPAPVIEPKATIVKQAETQLGEGPYQVAARVLGTDGKHVEDKELKELTGAFKKVYEDERKANPKMHDLMGLQVCHQFINKDNFNHVQSHITDAKLKERLTGIASQDYVMHAPVIKPIPHRPAVRPMTHVVPLPPVRQASA
jgi:hypothetical protein